MWTNFTFLKCHLYLMIVVLTAVLNIIFADSVPPSMAPTNTASTHVDIDLRTVPVGFALTIQGAMQGDFLGNSADAGDFNGDGQNDLIVGAHLADPNGKSNAGITYVIFGPIISLSATFDLFSFSSGPASGIRVFGPTGAGHGGKAVSFAGDVNGDGFDDIFLASPEIVSPGGRAYVLFGHNGTTRSFSDIDLFSFTSGDTGFSIDGAANNDRLGLSLAAAGDVNNDGFDDIIVGASEHDPSGRTRGGAAYVLFGHNTSTPFTAMVMSSVAWGPSVGFRIIGGAAEDRLGTAVAGVGDVNGDGIDDILVGAYNAAMYGRAGAGAAYVLFGHSTGYAWGNLDMRNFNATAGVGFKITGATTNARAGLALSKAGDINGDGIDDLIVSSTFAAPYGRSEAGSVLVLFGDASFGDTDIDLLTFVSGVGRGFQLHGALAGDRLGRCVGTAGDVNGDGYTDLIIGAHEADRLGRSDNGLTYVIFGQGNSASYSDIDLSTFVSGETGFQLIGDNTNSGSGRYVGGVGDLSGDGIDDFVIGAPEVNHNGRSKAGVLYLFYGRGQPTAQPTVPPTMQPSISPAHIDLLLSSPTYRVRNGFAFAVLSSNGTVHTWGEAPHGGDSSSVAPWLRGNVTLLVGSRFAFSAVTSNDQLVSWGATPTVTGAPTTATSLLSLTANEAAFAGVDSITHGVLAYGSPHNGGNVVDDSKCSGYSQQLSSGVASITASAGAFAALKADGTVYAWGNPHTGAGVSSETMPVLAGVIKVFATREAFAALLSSGRVITWGNAATGGDSSIVSDQLLGGVVHIVASNTVFVAVIDDQSAVAWGYGPRGGDASAVASQLASGVTFIAHTHVAMAILKSDGSVVAWGDARGGGDPSAVQGELSSVVKIYGNSKSFVALRGDGSVVAWGKATYGGQIPSNKVSALSSGVISIYHTDRAFAALKDDGSVVVWGQAGHGGSPGAAVEAHLVSGVHTICSNDAAFSVIKTDGSVVGWGHPVSIPTAGETLKSEDLRSPSFCA